MNEKLKRFFKSIDLNKVLKYLAVIPTVLGILGGLQYFMEKRTASAEVGDITALEEYNVFDGTISVRGDSIQQVVIPSFGYVNLESVVNTDFAITYDDSGAWFSLLRPKSTTAGAKVFSFEVYNTWLPLSYIYDYATFDLTFSGETLYDVKCDVSYLDRGANVKKVQDAFRDYDGYFTLSQIDDLSDAVTYVYNGQEWIFITHLELNVYYVSIAPSGAQNTFDLEIYYSPKIIAYDDFRHAQSNVQAAYIQQFNADVDVWGGIVNSVTSILQLEILPNFSLLNLLELAIAIPLTVWLLKAWLGG